MTTETGELLEKTETRSVEQASRWTHTHLSPKKTSQSLHLSWVYNSRPDAVSDVRVLSIGNRRSQVGHRIHMNMDYLFLRTKTQVLYNRVLVGSYLCKSGSRPKRFEGGLVRVIDETKYPTVVGEDSSSNLS